MLSIKVGSVFCSLPSDAIQIIDYVASITALPFVGSPVEGLTNFNGQPVIQIDVASALGIERQEQVGQKRLIVNYAKTNYSLRVDEVVNLTKTEASSNQYPVRSLSLKELITCIKRNKKRILSPQKADTINSSTSVQTAIPVLLVVSGERTIAFLTHTIDHLQKIESLETLSTQSSEGDFLIKVKDHLLPTYFLGQLLGQEDLENESVAIIFKGEQSLWALCVQKVLKMEYVHKVYSSGTDARGLWYVTQTGEIRELMDANNLPGLHTATFSPRLWYVTPNGQIQELVDANQLLGSTNDSLDITITTPEETSFTLQNTDQLTIDGLRIYCGTSSYLLPLTMATRADKDWDQATMTLSRFGERDGSRKSDRIPCIDGNALLFGKPRQTIERTVRVNLSLGGEILLGIDRAVLSQSLSTAASWIKVDLPYPATQFFDAAHYDDETGQWILRFLDTIKFSDLPWIIKKSVVKAIIGWSDRD
jgi:chemotaxis signal transduction protein